MSKLLDDVVIELSRLPGVGRRTAMRLAMHMLRMEEHDVMLMTQAIPTNTIGRAESPYPRRMALMAL